MSEIIFCMSMIMILGHLFRESSKREVHYPQLNPLLSINSTSWGRTFWGTDADKKEIEDTFIALSNRFKSPAIIGEWGLSGKSVEPGASWRYFDFFVRTTIKYKIAAQLWDNGGDHFDRLNHVWRDPVKLAILQNAVKAVNNSIVSYGQEPVLYFAPGQAVNERSVNIDWNGNTLKNVRLGSETGKILKICRDYTPTATGVTFSAGYLSSLISTYPATQLGPLAKLWVIPSKGAAFPVSLTRNTLPTLSATYFNVTDTSYPFIIPVANWEGSTLATVQAIRKDGAILKDDWTQWLGPLEKGRLNWGDFEPKAAGVILSTSLLDTIKRSGQEVVLTLEFWPRVPGNNVTVAVRAL